MSEIRLSREQLDAIDQHGERTYPEECCGVMVGSSDSSNTSVVRLVEVENRREDEHRHNRYLIEPRKVLEITRSARDEGLDIVGYYHSHPDHPSRPSEFDRDHAWPNVSYLIVSVCQGKVADRHCWRLLSDRSDFEEERVILETPGTSSLDTS